jgi:hypothetical protein
MLRVEARCKSDVYERGFGQLSNGRLEFQGIPSEGVVVYEVGGQPDDISLHRVLKVGERYQTARSSVQVLAAIQDGFTVRIEGPRLPQQVTVPSVIGVGSRVARQAIQAAGLVPRFRGPIANSEVASQSPEGGDVVQRGSTVRLVMSKIAPL